MRRTLVVGGALLIAVVLAISVVVVRNGRQARLPMAEARAFLAAWAKADAGTVDQLAVPGSGASADQAAFREQVEITQSSFRLGNPDGRKNGAVRSVHLQPSQFGSTPGQGMWEIFRYFLANPDDVAGTAERLERCRSAGPEQVATCHL